MSNTPQAALVAAVSTGTLLAALAGQAAAVGIGAVALVVLLWWMSLRSEGRPSRATVAVIAIYGTLSCAAIVCAFILHRPDEPLATIGGFPAGTAMLVYGVAPLGFLLGMLYGLAFDRDILPPDRQREFLDRFAAK